MAGNNNVIIVHFCGYPIETTLTNQGDMVNTWVRSFRADQKRIVGLDCEWKPNTHANMNNKTALLQLCVETKCLIVQLRHLDYIPQSLADFLANPNNHFAGVAVDADVARLAADYGLRCTSTADIQDIAMARWDWGHAPGLNDILHEVEGLRVEKPVHVRRSNWERRVLELEQVKYAAIDAFAYYLIGYDFRCYINPLID